MIKSCLVIQVLLDTCRTLVATRSGGPQPFAKHLLATSCTLKDATFLAIKVMTGSCLTRLQKHVLLRDHLTCIWCIWHQGPSCRDANASGRKRCQTNDRNVSNLSCCARLSCACVYKLTASQCCSACSCKAFSKTATIALAALSCQRQVHVNPCSCAG